MFFIDVSTASLCDVELCEDLLQKGSVSLFRDPLRHILTLLLQIRLELSLIDRSKSFYMTKEWKTPVSIYVNVNETSQIVKRKTLIAFRRPLLTL